MQDVFSWNANSIVKNTYCINKVGCERFESCLTKYWAFLFLVALRSWIYESQFEDRMERENIECRILWHCGVGFMNLHSRVVWRQIIFNDVSFTIDELNLNLWIWIRRWRWYEEGESWVFFFFFFYRIEFDLKISIWRYYKEIESLVFLFRMALSSVYKSKFKHHIKREHFECCCFLCRWFRLTNLSLKIVYTKRKNLQPFFFLWHWFTNLSPKIV